MRWRLLGAATLIAVTACSPSTSVDTTTSTPAGGSSTTTTGGTTGDPCASGGLAFTSEGLVATLGDSESDARRIDGIRWQPEATCERFIIDFASDSGSPARSLGLTGVSALAGTGIVRISLPTTVADTAVADLTTDGSLSARVYVIRDGDGGLFVDIIGAPDTAVGARAFAQASPARLIIDLVAAADAPVPVGPATSGVSVVPSPLPGPALYPLTVDAYAQPGLRSVRLLVISEEAVAIDRAIALGGGTDAWQAFSTRLDDGPSGPASLFVGTTDVNGRPAEGATVAVDLP